MKIASEKAIAFVFLSGWLLITIAALYGEYNLWWNRERTLYLGKNVEQQREVVLQRAGVPGSLAAKTEDLLNRWPEVVSYTESGDATSLSYIKYLLIPHVPSGGGDYTLQVIGDTLSSTQPALSTGQKSSSQNRQQKTPLGLILSLLFLSGCASLIRRKKSLSLGWPDAVALSCLGLVMGALINKFSLHSISQAFVLCGLIGVTAWTLALKDLCRTETGQGKTIRTLTDDVRRILIPEHIGMSQYLIIILVSIAMLNVFWSALMSVIVVPDDWDAWAIWGAKAKMLALGEGPLRDVTYFGHSDYPLLWPVIWAFSGFCSFLGWEEHWSRGWGTLFFLLSVWKLYEIVLSQTGDKLAGLFAAALFASIPMVPLLASWSYAEAPLWLFSLCVLSSLIKVNHEWEGTQVVLMGFFAAGAAMTKNEGVLLALVSGIGLLFLREKRTRSVFLYGLSFGLCYLPWFVWVRFLLDFSTHAMGGMSLSMDNLQRVVSRVPPSFEAIGNMWKDVRQWSVVGLGIALGWVWLLIRTELRRFYIHLFPFLMLLAFWIIIVFHTDEIYWQVGTAWNRLSVQVLVLLVPVVVVGLWNRLSRT